MPGRMARPGMMMTERLCIVFLASPACFLSFLLFGSSLHSLTILYLLSGALDDRLLLLSHASGICREGLVLFFQKKRERNSGERDILRAHDDGCSALS